MRPNTGSATTCLSQWLRGGLGGSGWASLPPRSQVERGGRGRRRGRRGRRSSRNLLLVLFIAKVGDVPVLFSDKFQQSKVYVLKSPHIQFIDDFWTFLLCSRDRCVVSMVQKTVVVPQLQFIACRRLPFRVAEADPHGPDYSADRRDSPVAVRFLVPVVRVVQILRCRRGEDIRAPTVAAQPQVLCGSDCRKLRKILFIKVVDTPFVSQRLIPKVLSTMVMIPQFLDKVIDDSVVRVVQAFPCRSHARGYVSAVAAHPQGRLHPCRGAEFDPHGFAIQQTKEIPLLPYTWWSMSLLCKWCAEETVVLPRLQLLRNSLRAAHLLRDELKGLFFLGPAHRDTAPIIRCRTVMRHRQRYVINTVSEPPPTTTTHSSTEQWNLAAHCKAA